MTLVVFLFIFLCTLAPGGAEVFLVDMSYEYKENYTYFVWPYAYLRRFPNKLNGQLKHYWLEDFDFYMGEHGGTHLDAPSHFCKGCKSMEQIPLSDLLSIPLCIVNVSAKTTNNPDYGLTVEDLQEWESQYGRIPEGSAVFGNFGWAQYYPERRTFLGSEEVDLENIQWHFPGFTMEAAKWLADQRMVKGIGTDAPGFDVGSDPVFPVHTFWLGRNLWGAEVVANMDKVPPAGARVSILPVKMHGGSGAASRIFATWSTDGATRLEMSAILITFVTIWAFIVIVAPMWWATIE